MKYIRTENGIYEVVGFDDECIIPSPIIKMNGKLTHCSDYKNCNQADTIEELCDEFVAVNPNNINANYITRAPLHSLYETEYKKYKRIIYGAIYTDKGLIYVAKMNEKGDLELI